MGYGVDTIKFLLFAFLLTGVTKRNFQQNGKLPVQVISLKIQNKCINAWKHYRKIRREKIPIFRKISNFDKNFLRL